jgi:FkbM family methyltransferase
MRARLAQTLGLARSLLTYYGVPGRARRMRRHYRPLVPPGSLCFDIGAHVGHHSRIWRGLGARVVMVEPQPRLADFLQRWLVQDEACVLVREALGAHEGETTLFVSRRAPTVSTLSAEWIARVQQEPGFARVAWDEQVRVPVTTLDALIGRYGLPTFCKIDVEGHEEAVLAGLSRPLPALSFEYIPATRDVAAACITRLEQLGRYRYAASEGEQFRPGPWLDAAGMQAWLQAQPADSRSGDIYALGRRG